MKFLDREHFTCAVTARSCVSPLGKDSILKIYYLVSSHGMWHLSSLTRGQTFAPCIGAQSLNGWTGRGVLEEDS